MNHGDFSGHDLDVESRRRPADISQSAPEASGQPHAERAAVRLAATPQATYMTAARAVLLAEAIRQRGHALVPLDPFGQSPVEDPGLDLAQFGISEEELRHLPAAIVRGPLVEGSPNAAAAIAALREVYCTRIGYEFAHLVSAEERQWLANAIESREYAPGLNDDEARLLLERLTRVEAFERILHRAFVGQKRFSGEGLDILIPMIDDVVRFAERDGIQHVVLGMAHRGRLATRTFVTGVPFAVTFHAFAEAARGSGAASDDPGDVKYHLGAIGRRSADAGGPLVHLRPNPSHLEFVNPVAEGYTRALQDDRSRGGAPRHDPHRALTILIHGDAAFPGQGVVAETLNLARLEGYTTGGTIHLIANNQVGFTTDPVEGRSTLYASDLAKGFDVPVFHVNADDVEACAAALRLAYAFRQRFHRDVVIDVVGYRRWGHNEGDEPAYTQPLLYAKIAQHPTVRELWARRLEERGVIRPGEADQLLAQIDAELRAAAEGGAPSGPAVAERPRASQTNVDTAVPLETLRALNAELLRRPEGFTPVAKLDQQLQRARAVLEPGKLIDWGHAEALAFASILADGTPIRLAGEDSERGTFSHRHLVLHDRLTGAKFSPLHLLPQARASFAVYNSPLSETGALGFEYGYSVGAPEALVLWEAQYGDFANVAQPIIDQFIVSSWAKWRERSAIVLLLPHGYEGQGPEHSSARIERFLQLFAEDNIRVVIPSTADQYFHVLRRQAAFIRRGEARPLILFSPKSLLRNPAAAATLERLTSGSFLPVIDDPDAAARRAEVRRLILASGKVAIELLTNPARPKHPNVAIVRLEEIAPFPTGHLARLLAEYPNVHEVVWLQEEPRNMGAYSFVFPRLWTLLPAGVRLRYIGRREKASPAEGSTLRHAAEQARIIAAAFAD
ncbi:MAG: 2-oxoglutarate dehydrogenase E1 component [Chloroflexota bacterium]|nr:2-oxoglutarate dehydrogenase E1 component [Dehalococcoidia bacterium]MDW8254435.1 2-oxoglutarate dehydrogenase E1 component [Chloroflexota bacterium]